MAAITRFSPEAGNCCASMPRSAMRPCLKVQMTWARKWRPVTPYGRDRQGVVRIDDPGECRLVGFRADIGVGGPYQLITSDALTGRSHARQTQVGSVGQ